MEKQAEHVRARGCGQKKLLVFLSKSIEQVRCENLLLFKARDIDGLSRQVNERKINRSESWDRMLCDLPARVPKISTEL